MPPTTWEPVHLRHDGPLARGSLVRLEPVTRGDGDGAFSSDPNLTLPFQYNPDTVTRSRTGRWEARKRRRAADGVQSAQQARQLAAHGASALLAEAETISFRLTFDATERVLRGGDDAARAVDEGVLPQMAFLELVSLGRDVERRDQRLSDGSRIHPIEPDQLLLSLGPSRWFPCVLTELTITEQRHSPQLVPMRAEADVRLTVLEPVQSSYNPLVKDAFTQLLAARERHAGTLPTSDATSLARQLGGGA